MLITFKSRAHADVIMFGEVALKLIRLMGRRDTVPSAIEPQDIPQALKSLQEGIAAEDVAVEENKTDDVEGEEVEQVSMHNRALLLIELLNAARRDNVPVMWEAGGRAY
jgi:hypothetical protein